MENVFDYWNYRSYLKDVYCRRKSENKSYSYRFFAQKAKLSSPNYLKLVMDGQRNLTHKNIRKFCLGLDLNEKESLYFENLVLFNQAKDEESKLFYQKNLKYIRDSLQRGLLSKDQYEVLSRWYPLVIKKMLNLEQQSVRPRDLAQRLNYRISPEAVKEALALLKRLGLIAEAKKGQYTIPQKALETPALTHSDAAARYHTQVLDLAKEALQSQSERERCFSSLIVSLNKKDLAPAFRRIHEFRNELDSFFGQNSTNDAVYQVNIQMFRVDYDIDD